MVLYHSNKKDLNHKLYGFSPRFNGIRDWDARSISKADAALIATKYVIVLSLGKSRGQQTHDFNLFLPQFNDVRKVEGCEHKQTNLLRF